MANIKTVSAQFEKARAARSTGDMLSAARLFLGCVFMAKRCRAASKYDLMMHAHTGAVMAAHKIIKTSSDNAERSEAGRIIAEANFIIA